VHQFGHRAPTTSQSHYAEQQSGRFACAPPLPEHHLVTLSPPAGVAATHPLHAAQQQLDRHAWAGGQQQHMQQQAAVLTAAQAWTLFLHQQMAVQRRRRAAARRLTALRRSSMSAPCKQGSGANGRHMSGTWHGLRQTHSTHWCMFHPLYNCLSSSCPKLHGHSLTAPCGLLPVLLAGA
jgi:hypothetical protein